MKNLGIIIVFETDYIPREVSRFIGRFPLEMFGVNYDIGNSAALGFDFQEEFGVYGDRILNVHPSLLPKYAGGMDTNVHEDVLKNGDVETGCTIHFVTDEVDGGPILIQKKCNIEAHDTVETLKNKVQKLEGEAFVEAIQLIQNN